MNNTIEKATNHIQRLMEYYIYMIINKFLLVDLYNKSITINNADDRKEILNNHLKIQIAYNHLNESLSKTDIDELVNKLHFTKKEIIPLLKYFDCTDYEVCKLNELSTQTLFAWRQKGWLEDRVKNYEPICQLTPEQLQVLWVFTTNFWEAFNYIKPKKIFNNLKNFIEQEIK